MHVVLRSSKQEKKMNIADKEGLFITAFNERWDELLFISPWCWECIFAAAMLYVYLVYLLPNIQSLQGWEWIGDLLINTPRLLRSDRRFSTWMDKR